MNLEAERARFPVLARFAYLNAGTFGPLARETVEAQERVQRADLERGRAGRDYFVETLALRDAARAAIAGELAVEPRQVALTTSTTDGVNTVLGGLRLEPGDEVVTTDVEHEGLLAPLRASGARLRVAAVRDRPAAGAADAILAEVTPATRLVALSHVAWTTGQVLPIAQVKAAVDAPVLVDGAQSAGAIRVDTGGVDYYTVSGQKWLCGPDSTGGLFVRDVDSLVCARPTYMSFRPGDPDHALREDAARFDSGWTPPGTLAGLVAALETVPEGKVERALAQAARCRELLLERGVDVVTEPGQGTLVSFRAPGGEPAELVAALYERGVVVRDLPGVGWIRASCGWWTSDGDLDRLVSALPV